MNTVITRPELTAEEKEHRAAVSAVRDLIRKEAVLRRMIKAAYRLPHSSDLNKAAMQAAREACGIDPKHVYPWNQHCIPQRDYGRAGIHALHLRLAELTGKPHVKELQPA